MTKENLKRMYELLKTKPQFKQEVAKMEKKYPALLELRDPKPSTESKEVKKSKKEVKE